MSRKALKLTNGQINKQVKQTMACVLENVENESEFLQDLNLKFKDIADISSDEVGHNCHYCKKNWFATFQVDNEDTEEEISLENSSNVERENWDNLNKLF